MFQASASRPVDRGLSGCYIKTGVSEPRVRTFKLNIWQYTATMGKEIGHIELTSKDLMATKKFYSKLFGWRFEMFGDGYAMFKTSQKGVGGGFQLGKKVKPGSTTFYVNVDTIPATQQKAKSLGGRILKKRKSIGGGKGAYGTICGPPRNVIRPWGKKKTTHTPPPAPSSAYPIAKTTIPFFSK